MTVMNPRSQDKKRRAQKFRDEFGRSWGATIEIATGIPTGPMSPWGWAPPKLGNGHPLMAPQAYVKFDAINRAGEMWHDFASWENDVVLAERRWEENLSFLAKQFYGDGAMRALTNPPPKLVEQAGPKPVIPSVLIRAMASGNQFVLGLDPVMPQWCKDGGWFAPPVYQNPEARRSEFPNAADEAPEVFDLTPARKGR